MEKSIAKVRALENRIDDFITAVTKVAEPTRAEAGCKFYELYQLEEDPTWFYFCEEWESEADLIQHLGSDHVKAFISQLDGIVEIHAEPVKWHKVV